MELNRISELLRRPAARQEKAFPRRPVVLFQDFGSPCSGEAERGRHGLPGKSDVTLFADTSTLRLILDALQDEEQCKQRRVRTHAAFTEILSMPEAAAIIRRKATRHAFTAIAASLTVGIALWFSSNAVKFGGYLLKQRTTAASSQTGSEPAARQMLSAPALAARREPRALLHPADWLRSMAARRAAARLTESFDKGMAAWGVTAKGWAPGMVAQPRWLRAPRPDRSIPAQSPLF